MSLRLITAPASEPVTVDEVKFDASIDGSESDVVIASLIKAARIEAEKRTGRALITQTWELVLDAFPAAEIEIGKLPVSTITSVKYYDTNGVQQTLASDKYALDADTLPGWVLPAYGTDWPDTYDMANAVVIRFVAGYGDASAVPDDIKLWIRAHAAREADKGQNQVVVSDFVDGLLDQYKLSFL